MLSENRNEFYMEEIISLIILVIFFTGYALGYKLGKNDEKKKLERLNKRRKTRIT